MRTNTGGPQTVLEACALTVIKAQKLFFTAGGPNYGNHALVIEYWMCQLWHAHFLISWCLYVGHT